MTAAEMREAMRLEMKLAENLAHWSDAGAFVSDALLEWYAWRETTGEVTSHKEFTYYETVDLTVGGWWQLEDDAGIVGKFTTLVDCEIVRRVQPGTRMRWRNAGDL